MHVGVETVFWGEGGEVSRLQKGELEPCQSQFDLKCQT